MWSATRRRTRARPRPPRGASGLSPSSCPPRREHVVEFAPDLLALRAVRRDVVGPASPRRCRAARSNDALAAEPGVEERRQDVVHKRAEVGPHRGRAARVQDVGEQVVEPAVVPGGQLAGAEHEPAVGPHRFGPGGERGRWRHRTIVEGRRRVACGPGSDEAAGEHAGRARRGGDELAGGATAGQREQTPLVVERRQPPLGDGWHVRTVGVDEQLAVEPAHAGR